MEEIDLTDDEIFALWDWDSGELFYCDILQFAHDYKQVLLGDKDLLEQRKKEFKLWQDSRKSNG